MSESVSSIPTSSILDKESRQRGGAAKTDDSRASPPSLTLGLPMEPASEAAFVQFPRSMYSTDCCSSFAIDCVLLVFSLNLLAYVWDSVDQFRTHPVYVSARSCALLVNLAQ